MWRALDKALTSLRVPATVGGFPVFVPAAKLVLDGAEPPLALGNLAQQRSRGSTFAPGLQP